ncbi:MAG: CDP-alcohol phosphatidyltransferase family protein [Actinomycetota bacterium]
MLNAKIRGIWDKGMRPVGGFVGRSGITPNQITILGVAVQGAVSYLIVSDRLAEAGFVLIAAALLDTVDGAVAKARGLTTTFGAFLDSTMDRLSDALVFLPIAWLYLADPTPERADQQWVAALSLVTLVLSFLVSYAKARAEGLGFECNVGLIERAERLIIMIVVLVFSALLPLGLAVLALASLLTLVQRIVHVRKQASAH